MKDHCDTMENKTRRIAIIDDDSNWLSCIKELYEEKKVEADIYRYPQQHDDFLEHMRDYTHILIDHRLGGTNGANVARNVLASGVHAHVFIITGQMDEAFKGYKMYLQKSTIVEHPEVIFDTQLDEYDMCVEATILRKTEI